MAEGSGNGSDIERPIWQRTVVNAHVLAFRDIYLGLGEVKAAARRAEAGAGGAAPEAPRTPAQRAFLRLMLTLPRSLFGDSAEQRLTYARVFTAVRGACREATAAAEALQGLASAAEGAARAASAEGDPGRKNQGSVSPRAAEGAPRPQQTTFQSRLTGPLRGRGEEDGAALRAWCDAFEAAAAAGVVAA
jgi:hypothetical protein